MSSATSSRKPLYSVIIVTYNSRDNIRVCLDSLRGCGTGGNALTDGSHEVIVVDNDSRDGTQDYLRAQGDIRAILNGVNNGFSKGCNQGAAIAQGEYVIFLNPDTLVTKGWSHCMARYFEDKTVGAVGPVSNYVAGLQRLDLNLPPAWRDAKSFPGNGAAEVAENLARILKDGNAGKGVATKLLIGFCLMMERSRYASMGGMDEDLFLGNDDLDLSWRLRNAGLKLVVAADAFVFHEGQKSFKTEKKSTVDRLTQESTDAMYKKLVRHYGGRKNVPAALDLWGIGWFSPSQEVLARSDADLLDQAGGSMMNGLKRNTAGKNDSAPQGAQSNWNSVTAVVYAGGASGDVNARLERTLAALPARPGVEIIVLNGTAGSVSADAPTGANLRKLDLGAQVPARQAIEIALALMPGSHAFFCVAGVESSTMFNHWLDKRDLASLDAAMPLPLRIGEGMGPKDETASGCALLARKDWLAKSIAAIATADTAAFLAALGALARSEAAGKAIDPPWLMARASDMPVGLTVTAPESAPAAPAPSAASAASSEPKQSWTAVQKPKESGTLPLSKSLQAALGKMGDAQSAQTVPADFAGLIASIAAAVNSASASGPAAAVNAPAPAPAPAKPAIAPKGQDGISLYPESLRPFLRDSKYICFAGSKAGGLGITGGIKVFNVLGEPSQLIEQDLIILRITTDIIDRLPERLINLRKQATGLKRLIVLFDGNEAMGIKGTAALPAIDLTADGIRMALWRAGFAVSGERPYLGFPENGATYAALKPGWLQIEATPRSSGLHTAKKVSIVILGFNQVEYTKKCIESIRKHTKQAYELILVDNGSKDGTEAFFRSVPGAKVIRNAENLGVSKGWNQGMRLAEGDYILILNNDVIVGPGWLENMVRLAESDPSIGLVGPRSNYIAGPQVVSDVPYKNAQGYNEAGIPDYISKWQAEHDLSACEFGFIKGFCHLIPRRVFQKVGFYDERFGKGNFEDDDYCVRVRFHGFRALFADDSFIHHFGSVSFNQESVDWRALMIENQEKYNRKWAKGAAAVNDTQVSIPGQESKPTPVNTPVTPTAPSAAKTAAPLSAPARNILQAGQAAFESGDLDKARTLFLEAQAAAPANPEPYCSLGVVLFSEDLSTEAMSFFIRSLELDGSHADAAQNILDVLASQGGNVSREEAAQLASRFPGNPVFARFLGGLEKPAGAKPQATAALPRPAASQLPVWRSEVEALIQAGKYAAAVDTLEARMQSNRDTGPCCNYLGIIAHACGDADLALMHFTTALKHCPNETDVLFNLSDTLLAVGRADEAARLLEDSAHKTGVESDPSIPDLAATAEQIRHAMARGNLDASALLASRDANQQAESLLRSGGLEKAVEYLQAALESDKDDFRAFNNLGLASWYTNEGDAAWNFFCLALEVRPAWGDALINAFDTALKLGDAESMDVLLDNALATNPNHPQALAMRKHILAQGQAIHMFGSLQALEANSALLSKAETLMEQGKQGEAIAVFLDAVKAQAENPQAYNGLGIIAFTEKRHSDAFGLFELASSLHPLDQDILLNLWQCAQALGRTGEVLPRLRYALGKNPAQEGIKAAIKEFA